jgi:hypothetical protein
MPEIGLVKFATIALQVGQAALPAYRQVLEASLSAAAAARDLMPDAL